MKFNLNKYLILPILTLTPAYSLMANTGIRVQHSAPTYKNGFWPNGEIFYRFNEYSFTPRQKNIIVAQMRYLESIANIKFIEEPYDTRGYYINITNGRECSSYVGRVFPGQKVNLSSNGCLSTVIIQHELMHALGFYHEQSRYDRDKKIRVNYNNISEDCWSDFEKEGPETLLFGEYDLQSIMHYPSFSCSIRNYAPSFTERNTGKTINQAINLSELDKEGLRKAYGPPINKNDTSSGTDHIDTNPVTDQTQTETTPETNTVKKKETLLLYALNYNTYYQISYYGKNNVRFYSELVEVSPHFVDSKLNYSPRFKKYEYLTVAAHDNPYSIDPRAVSYRVKKSEVAKACLRTKGYIFEKCQRN